jgi:hypothetical protein
LKIDLSGLFHRHKKTRGLSPVFFMSDEIDNDR